jgi:hypothetical protein
VPGALAVEVEGGRWRRSPLALVAVVTALVLVNQVAFTVYVLRVHGGDPSFVARDLPDGWFDLASGAGLDRLARAVPRPELLAPSVLRVQAFLELPLVVGAYLVVCRWFSPGVYQRALWLVGPVAVVYTATFCVVEWRLHNPYTVEDIVLRLAAAVVVPVVARRLSTDAPDRAHNLAGLLVFVVSAVAFAGLGLVVYDTALLYNLGHLDTRLPVAAVCVLGLVAARRAARFVPDRPPGPGLDVVARAFGWLLVVGFVPALPLRYGLNLGARSLAVAGLLVVGIVVATRSIRDARGPWLVPVTAATAAGLAASAIALVLPADHTETRLLWAGALFAAAALPTCALLDS